MESNNFYPKTNVEIKKIAAVPEPRDFSSGKKITNKKVLPEKKFIEIFDVVKEEAQENKESIKILLEIKDKVLGKNYKPFVVSSVTTVSYGESLMKQYLDLFFTLGKPKDNYRPEWLKNPKTGKFLEIDRYYPSLKLAFEFQGEQHFKNDKKLPHRVYCDTFKQQQCYEHSIWLIYITSEELNFSYFYKLLEKGKFLHHCFHNNKMQKKFDALDEEARQYNINLFHKYPDSIVLAYNRDEKLKKYRKLKYKIADELNFKWNGFLFETLRPLKNKKRAKTDSTILP